MTTTTEPTRAASVRADSPQQRVTRLAAAVLIPMLAALVSLVGAVPFSQQGNLALLLIVVGFVVSEPLVFHIEARQEAVSMSPTDIPLAVGLLVLSPLSLVAARIVGSALGLLIWRRPPLLKLLVNLTAFTAEAIVASLVLRLLVDTHQPVSVVMWLSLILAIFVGLTVGGLVIATAISFFENNLAELLRKEICYSYIFYLPGAALGASLAIPLLVEPWLLLIFGPPAPAIWLGLRAYGRLMHRFTDLRQIHEFSSQVARTTHLQELLDTAASEIAIQLRAGSVAILIWDTGSGSAVANHGAKDLVASIPPTYESDALRRFHEPQTVVETDSLFDGLTSQGVHDALAVVLDSNDTPLGLLIVADRTGAIQRFDADDQGRLHTISEQLAVAVRKVQMQQQIQHDATHDRLTGLPNRLFFEAWARMTVGGPESLQDALLMVDLDRFKEVNDTLGHAAGDELLRQVSERLVGCVAESDLVARFGGDEFAILAPGAGLHEAELLAAHITEALERAFVLEDTPVAIGSSIGIAIAPEHGRTPEMLVRRADLAMYDAKRRHSRAQVFSEDIEGANSVRLALLGDLRDALARGALNVFFQPKTDLRTREVVAVEALARWNSPVHGPVGPDVFIPLAEQAGLITELTDFVLDSALRAARHWSDLGYEIGVAVNLSPQSLLNERLPEIIGARLTHHRVPARLLTVEITEQTVLADSPRTNRIIEELDRLGVKFSIDDFGTGHSSLANLRRLPISELKIDRSFVQDMLVEHADEVIVKSTIDLGHNLGFDVLAEGVETPGVVDRLRSLGCDLVQGYGICRPLPADQLERWLRTADARRLRTQPNPAEPLDLG